MHVLTLKKFINDPPTNKRKCRPTYQLEKLDVMLVGKTFERTCCKILASFFSTGEMLACSCNILIVRSNNSRRVLSSTSDDSSGNAEV